MTQRQAQREDAVKTQGAHDVKMENWRDASISQGMPVIARKPPEARKKQRRIPYRSQREHGPVDTLISDFKSPKL